MIWPICFIVAFLLFIASAVFAVIRAKSKYKRGRILDPLKILIMGVISSALILFLPIYVNTFKESNCGILETALISVHNTIRLFVVDGDFEFITANVEMIPDLLQKAYTLLFSLLFVLAPVLTFGFVLSFFKNLSAYKKLLFHRNSAVFVFSELSEKSLALAESLCVGNPKERLFVFTDVFEKSDEENYDLIESAKELGAVCFKDDIVTIKYSLLGKKSELNFFTIGENQSENISQALKLLADFKKRENTKLYVFSTQLESEMLLSGAFAKEKDIKIRVRRVDEVQSLIFRNLYEKGYDKLFRSAYDDGSGIKKINAVVIGMGKHGTEMLKALSWMCQMDGYLVEINAFDIEPSAEKKFLSLCPELMKFSGKIDIPGENKYTINIYPKVDVDTVDFDEKVLSLPRTTYIFVALGDDEKNVATAVKLRTIFERKGYNPEIQAVVYNSDKKESLSGVTNFKGQDYNIDFIGDTKSSYSEKVIIGSDLELLALSRHLKWYIKENKEVLKEKEKEFWQYNYNYKSSIASAIHSSMKVLCGIPGADKKPEERTEEERKNLRILEHNRWNAYMRSEGYIYGGTIEKTGRNDLAKKHNCLVAFEKLPPWEQEKDDD